MTWRFELVSGPHGLTEGPVWDGSRIFFTDMPNRRILSYDVEGRETSVHRSDVDAANGLKFGPDGRLYGCEMNGRRVSRYEADGTTTVVASHYGGTRLNGPNDLCFDSSGRLWFSDPFYEPPWVAGGPRELSHESVFRCDPTESDPELERMTFDTTRPNGLLLSPDEDTLYVAQSDYRERGDRELRAYEVADDQTLGDYRVLHDFHPHRAVDGMCLTEGGNVVACAGRPADRPDGPGPALYVFAPDGEVLERHQFPGGAPTNCCFGGSDLQTLFATGKDGGLYRVDTDHTGYLGPPRP